MAMERHGQSSTEEHSAASRKRRRTDDSDPQHHSVLYTHRDDRSHMKQDEYTIDAAPYMIIHRVQCDHKSVAGEDHSDHPGTADYRDAPRLFSGDSRGSALRGSSAMPTAKPEDLIKNDSAPKLIVLRTYDCQLHHHRHRSLFRNAVPAGFEKRLPSRLRPWCLELDQDTDVATVDMEQLIISDALSTAIEKSVKRTGPPLNFWEPRRDLQAPYNYFYHCRDVLRQMHASELDSASVDGTGTQMRLLLQYIDDTQASSFTSADSVFATGRVTRDSFSKLFRPYDTVVTMAENGHPRAYSSQMVSANPNSVILNMWTWQYSGSFYKESSSVAVHWPSTTLGAIDIDDLSFWPLRWNPKLQSSLIKRGRKVWACRRPRLVGYKARPTSSFELSVTNPRYMIDYETYHSIHGAEEASPKQLSEAEMSRQGIDIDLEQQNDEFYQLLPSKLKGFAFHEKRWRDLDVDDLEIDIRWRKEAFDSLVLDDEAKRHTIEALITGHQEEQNGVDIVDDKGKGLIMLLHGPPGTGKTLTAETVAERAMKPLYRVTCADIGTDPVTAEEYLEKILHLGSKWNCVVLLDEADVFLEERRTTDLARNAFVSIFLRTLEYYSGILILTTNRVGTFDEAFTSRIQMAIHYPRLRKWGRLEVWRKLLEVLAESGFPIARQTIDHRLERLAEEYQLNGRQIRNNLKSATQIANSKGEALNYGHLDSVMKITGDLQQYLKDTRGGLSDEELASAHYMRAKEDEEG